MRTRSTSLARALLAIALLVALHPMAGAGSATRTGLAHWLKDLWCACEHCAAPKETVASTCCSAEPTPAVPAASDDCEGECACTHPAEVPIPGHEPLTTPREDAASGDQAFAHWLAAGSWVPIATRPDLALFRPRALEPPPGADRSRAATVHHGSGGTAHLRLQARGALGLLAVFSTALC